MSDYSKDASDYLTSSTLGDLFSQSHEKGRADLPIVSLTMDRGLIPRDEVERRVESNLLPEGHRLIHKGDLAYNMMRMWQGVCYMAKYDCLTSPAYVVIRPHPGVDPKFAEYYLRFENTVAAFRQRSFGVVDDRLRLYFTDFCGVKSSIPSSLIIQRKIARILTTLDNLIEKTKALIAKYQSIKQGMMADLFTRGVDANGKLRPPQSAAPELYKQSELGWIPMEWEVDLIENVLERIIDYRGKTPTKTDSGIPLITAKNVRMGFIDVEPAEFIAEHNFESWMTRGIPANGDVLFTTEAPLGNVAQITTNDRLAFAQRVIILQGSKRIRNAFLKYLLMTDSPQRWIRTKGTGSTVEGIKQSVFRRLPVAFPNRVEEQRMIVIRLDSLARQLEIEQQALCKLQLHKTGLMQDLLTGKVPVKPDASEESANV